jgi:hypothetical protein
MNLRDFRIDGEGKMVEQLSSVKAEALVQYWESGSKDDFESAVSIFSKAEH